MTEQSIHTILKESFSKSSKEDWLRIAIKELKEKNSIDDLVWKSGDLNFSPYHDKKDVNAANYLKEDNGADDTTLHLKAGGWQNLPKITVSNEKKANTIALQCLAVGADGVLFDMSGHRNVELDLLLEKINWSICSISFLPSAEEKNFPSKISSYLAQQHYDPLNVRGTIFWLQFPEISEKSMHALSAYKNFQTNGFLVEPGSPSAEICESLIYAVRCMEHLTQHGLEKDAAFQRVSISLASDENFFVTIAKCKALRSLWYQLSQAYQIDNYEPSHLQLHGRSETAGFEKFQPHANILKNTYDAIALVLGGGNSLTICPSGEDNAMMNRIALHASNILKEESHLDKVANAIAGAYTIEVMIEEFSQAAWKAFQNKVTYL